MPGGPNFDGGRCSGIGCNTSLPPRAPTLYEIASKTSKRVVRGLKDLTLTYDENGSIDWSKTLGNTVGSDLRDCAKMVGGVCGISLGASQGFAVGGRYSADFFVDQEGNFDLFGTIGGGGYIPPVAIATGGLVPASHVETGKVAVTVVKNGTIEDMKGVFGQFGGGFAAGTGASAEWVVGRNAEGQSMHGVSIAGTSGYFLDLHGTITYSASVPDLINSMADRIELITPTR